MKKHEAITDLAVSKEFNELFKKIDPPHLREYLKSEVIMSLFETPDSVFEAIKDLRYYAIRIALNMVYNRKGSFCKTYRSLHEIPMDHGIFIRILDGYAVGSGYNNKIARAASVMPDAFNMSFEDRESREIAEDYVVGMIDHLYWYNAELLRLYIKHGTFRAVSFVTGINHISVYKNIKKSLALLRAKSSLAIYNI